MNTDDWQKKYWKETTDYAIAKVRWKQRQAFLILLCIYLFVIGMSFTTLIYHLCGKI